MSAAGKRPVTLVLADDHVVVRRGLRRLLERVPGFEVVAEAGDARKAVSVAIARDADVLVLDLNMPGEPLEALTELVASEVPTAPLILTMETDPAFADRALELGAKGYVLKRAADEELVDAIHAVAAGGTHVSAAIRTGRRDSEGERSSSDLTARETEVLRLIARGHTSAEIGERLSLSERTIETHRAHIQEKLALSGRRELVSYALAHDLL